jgi:hypothetical protein
VETEDRAQNMVLFSQCLGVGLRNFDTPKLTSGPAQFDVEASPVDGNEKNALVSFPHLLLAFFAAVGYNFASGTDEEWLVLIRRHSVTVITWPEFVVRYALSAGRKSVIMSREKTTLAKERSRRSGLYKI